jgi:hypothetical protein
MFELQEKNKFKGESIDEELLMRFKRTNDDLVNLS